MNKYFKYALIAVGAFFIFAGFADGKSEPLLVGIILCIVGLYSDIKNQLSGISKEKVRKEMLSFKELYDKEIITEEEYNFKIKNLKDKI